MHRQVQYGHARSRLHFVALCPKGFAYADADAVYTRTGSSTACFGCGSRRIGYVAAYYEHRCREERPQAT